MKNNDQFKQDYDHLFNHDPEAANLYLLLCELADKKGRVKTNSKELARLISARFDDPTEYALGGVDDG